MKTDAEKSSDNSNRNRSNHRAVGAGDITRPHLRHFFEVRSAGNEPPLNLTGFWPKPAFHTAKGPLDKARERGRADGGQPDTDK